MTKDSGEFSNVANRFKDKGGGGEWGEGGCNFLHAPMKFLNIFQTAQHINLKFYNF